MELRYTADHEWVAVVDGHATVGITDYAQRALGDVVYVQLPDVGATVTRGAVAAVVESVKAASDIFAPLTGRVVEINAAASEDPSLLNKDPLGGGWLFKVELQDRGELGALLDETAYTRIAS
jgi:glycine cleavage system H protein